MEDLLEKELPTISASKLIKYRICGRQYKYTYIDKLNDSKNVSALMGSALHKALELTNKDTALQTFQDYMHTMYNEWLMEAKEIKGEELFHKCLKDGRAILEKFDWEGLSTARDLELKFTLPFPNAENPICNITGIIDRIDTTDTGITLYDYKSSGRKPTFEELDNDPQFVIYYWAASILFGSAPEIMYWYHLRTNKLILADIKTNFESKFAQLQEDIEYMLNNPSYERRMLDTICRNRCAFYDRCYGAKKPDQEETDQE